VAEGVDVVWLMEFVVLVAFVSSGVCCMQPDSSRSGIMMRHMFFWFMFCLLQAACSSSILI
jgi:hypothetical protein